MSAYTEEDPWFIRDGETYVVASPLRWEIGCVGSGLWLNVPAGTSFDVTIPWCLRWAFNRHEPRYLKAAAVHDTMLDAGWSRLTAGAEFAEALRADAVGPVRRLLMWLAVSLWRWR